MLAVAICLAGILFSVGALKCNTPDGSTDYECGESVSQCSSVVSYQGWKVTSVMNICGCENGENSHFDHAKGDGGFIKCCAYDNCNNNYKIGDHYYDNSGPGGPGSYNKPYNNVGYYTTAPPPPFSWSQRLLQSLAEARQKLEAKIAWAAGQIAYEGDLRKIVRLAKVIESLADARQSLD